MAAVLAAAAAVGVESSDTDGDEDGPLYLWPECEPAWDAFLDLCDQWREGVLPRSEILAHLHEVEPDAERRRDVYAGVCVCARAAARVRADHMRERAREVREQQERDRLHRGRRR